MVIGESEDPTGGVRVWQAPLWPRKSTCKAKARLATEGFSRKARYKYKLKRIKEGLRMRMQNVVGGGWRKE